jgi:ethanolaminephosphotransferase
MWMWSVVGALDTNLPWVFGQQVPVTMLKYPTVDNDYCLMHMFCVHSAPIIQSSPRRTAIFVYITLLMSFLSYARFCMLVIQDITNYLGIACFTARKRDSKGVWREAKDVPNGKGS